MRAHPIPQNVVSFEDRIFGPLTAKQFSIIATGLSFAFVLYMSPLPGSLKLPVVVIISLFSVAAGLVKINDMSLDVWLTTFIGAIYSPTQFIWQKASEGFISSLQLTHKHSATTKAKDSQTETQKIRKDLYPGLFTEELQDEKEQEFLSQLNFEIPIPQIIAPLVKENTTALNIPIEKPQIKEAPPKAILPIQQIMTHTEKPQTTTIKEIQPIQEKKEAVISQKPKVVKSKAEGYPKRRQTPSTLKAKGITPLASEINFTNQPVFTLKISGQEPQYVQGLSNLTVNRAIHKMDKSQTIFPVKGEKHFEISSDLEKRFKQNDLEINNVDILKIEEKAEEKPSTSPVIKPKQMQPKPINISKNTDNTQLPSLNLKEVGNTNLNPKNTPPPLAPKSIPTKETVMPKLPLPPSVKPVVTEKPNIPPPPLPIKKAPVVEKPVFPVSEETKPTPKPQIQKTVIPTTPSTNLKEERVVAKEAPINKIPFIPTPTTSPISAPSQKPVFNFKSKDFMPPQIPNIIAGVIRDQFGVTISNAIVLIKDENSTPVRALKTNKLGQFSIATPLPNGAYKLEIEKEGCQFKVIDLELKGELIPLLEITGTTA